MGHNKDIVLETGSTGLGATVWFPDLCEILTIAALVLFPLYVLHVTLS